jgi:baseplate J-like protein
VNEGAANSNDAACGCCAGIHASTPTGIDNRSGLSSIRYRIGDYAAFKASMLTALSSSKYSELGSLHTRDADDYTLALIDAVACSADVLTFYQERVANESYLRSATERVSLQELGKLIGYRLRPGVAAETWLAFALETPRAAPAGLALEPGAFVTGIPTALTLPAGLKVQSVPGPDEKPQTFETVEEIGARPEWNAIRPWFGRAGAPGAGATETWFQGVANNLKVGDALVFVDGEFVAHPTTNEQWDFRLIDAVETEPGNSRTHVRWAEPLKRVSSSSEPTVAPQVFVFRRKAAVFGNNAPRWSSMGTDFKSGYPGGPDLDEWPDFTLSAGDGKWVNLDAIVSEARPDGLAVLRRFGFDASKATTQASSGGVKPVVTTSPKGSSAGLEREELIMVRPPHLFTELYRIERTSEVSLAAFALSGKVTRIEVAGSNFGDSFFNAENAVRETSVYVQSERLTLAPYPVTVPVDGAALPLAVSPDGLFAGRKLIVAGVRTDDETKLVHRATLVDAQPHPNGAVLTITPPLPASLQRESVVVHANVANATHGETAAQILGAGDASRSFQRFELRRLPLTYLSASNETGADSELSVRIGDLEWTEKSTLFGATSTERAYTLSLDEQGRSWVTFGDGVHGARLPSGVNNVRAKYRQGLGDDGNVASDTLTQLLTRPLGLKSVSNPMPARGGTDPEPAEQARRTMPLGTRTLGRAVSLLDYEDFALAFTGIAKAQAQVLQLPAGPTVAVTVAGPRGESLTSSDSVWQNLRDALRAGGDPHVPVQLLSYQPIEFHLGLKVKRDPAYELRPLLATVEAALRAHYAFDARALGQPVLQSEIIAVAHSVRGVVAVDLDFLYVPQPVPPPQRGPILLFATHVSLRPGPALVKTRRPNAPLARSRQNRLLASRMRVGSGVALPAELLTLSSGPLDLLEEMP